MHEETASNPYLEREVLSASPIRLRWMLIKRAEELCTFVDQLYLDQRLQEAAQWLLRIREILGELLAGVTDADNPVSSAVADFYVFLIKLTLEIEQTSSRQRLETLRELLSIEAETWSLVLQRDANQQGMISPPAGLMPPLGEYTSATDSFSFEV